VAVAEDGSIFRYPETTKNSLLGVNEMKSIWEKRE